MKISSPLLILAAVLCTLGAIGAGLGVFGGGPVELKGVSLLPQDDGLAHSLVARELNRLPLNLKNDNSFPIRVVGNNAC
jgi:hypothetical protein